MIDNERNAEIYGAVGALSGYEQSGDWMTV